MSIIPWPNGSFHNRSRYTQPWDGTWQANAAWGYCVSSAYSKSRRLAYIKALFNVILYRPYACEWPGPWRALRAKFYWM